MKFLTNFDQMFDIFVIEFQSVYIKRVVLYMKPLNSKAV